MGILAAIAVPKMVANREDTLLVAIKTDLETIKQSVVAMVVAQGESTVNSFGDALVLNENLWGAVESSGTQGFGTFIATPLKQATAIASKYTPKSDRWCCCKIMC